MDKFLYITGVICITLVIVGFAVTTFAEPAVANGQNETDTVKEYTVKEFFAVSDASTTAENGENKSKPAENPQNNENATEAISDGLSTDDYFSDNSKKHPRGYYDIPLGQALQDVVITECAVYGISPAVVFALIEKESNYDTHAMGDDGRSFGLMQIQQKWHLQRMIDMDCTDLFDAGQNVRVGISILGELYNVYGNEAKAVTAYNKGSYDGDITGYAKGIMSQAKKIQKTFQKNKEVNYVK